MFTKTKMALVASLLAATSTGALAFGFDPNPANRYPAYASPEGASAPYLGRATQSVVTQDVAARRGSRPLPSRSGAPVSRPQR